MPNDTVTLELPRSLAEQLRKALEDGLFSEPAATDGTPPSSDHRVLADDDVAWERVSGGHLGQTWITDHPEEDRWDAAAFYGSVQRKAKVFIDVLIDHPGVQMSVDDICAAAPDVFTNASSIAGAINGLRKPREAVERRYPFEWWEGAPGEQTRYAMKQNVAALFQEVRGGG